MSYRYRCETCRTTSARVRGRDAILYEQHEHRRLRHGGHVPDGEQVIEVRTRPGDLPIQYYAIALVALALLFGPALLDHL
jgi:hypothetical protein